MGNRKAAPSTCDHTRLGCSQHDYRTHLSIQTRECAGKNQGFQDLCTKTTAAFLSMTKKSLGLAGYSMRTLPKPSLAMRLLQLLFFSISSLHAQVLPNEALFRGNEVHLLQNNLVKFSVYVGKDQLISDKLEAQSQWAAQNGAKSPPSIETDADFALDIMYTDWQAPGKANNSENPILL